MEEVPIGMLKKPAPENMNRSWYLRQTDRCKMIKDTGKEMRTDIKPYIHTVQYYETDRMGITHHSNYIRMMEEARLDYMSQIGWPYDELEKSGVISPVVAVECRYLATTTYADRLTIRVSIEEFKGVRLKMQYRIEKEDGTLAATAKSEHCFLGKNGIPMRVKKEMPDLYEALQP